MYRERATGKTCIFLFFLLGSFFAAAQNSGEDSLIVRKKAEQVLEKEISLTWPGGTLSGLLKKLSAGHGLNFSFSSDLADQAYVAPANFSSVPLSVLLESALSGTRFSYLVVGSIIVIVNKEAIIPEELFPAPADTAVSDTTSVASASVVQHIYTPSGNDEKLPPHLRRTLSRMYREELRLAARRNRDIEEPEKRKDTIPGKEKVLGYPAIFKYRHYFAVAPGYRLNKPGIKNISGFDWDQDLEFDPGNSLQVELSAGLVRQNFLLEAGIRLNGLALAGILKTDGPPATVPPPAQAGKDSIFRFSHRFLLFSIPFKALYFHRQKKLVISGGPGVIPGFVIREKRIYRELADYYERSVSGSFFHEKDHPLYLAASFSVAAGYTFKKRLHILAGSEYSRHITAIYENSLYKVRPHSFSFQLTVRYLFK